MKEHPQYLTETQVAEITGIAIPTLRNHRFERRGIPYCKIGRSVRYRLSDVIEYMDSHLIDTGEVFSHV